MIRLPLIGVICLLLSIYVVKALLLPKKGLNPKAFIDVRSDTLTKPTHSMRKLMFEAEVGDDVFREDPTVNRLESRVATMFGKEKSLFFPTGTMANLAATMSWCGQRGSESIVGDCSHIHLYEQANIAQVAGVSPRSVVNRPDGTMNLDTIEAYIRTDNIHYPVTSLICLENTHNYCGGRLLPDGYTGAVSKLAKKAGIPLHLDGARIWNAATASTTAQISCSASLASLVAPVDSVTACLSKGLGAPVGSMLVGPADFIERARRTRKALGGGMRQVGVLAAAGMQALDDFEAGILNTDHGRAKAIATGLSQVPGLQVDPAVVDTNIVLVHIDPAMGVEPTAFASELRQQYGVLVLPFGPRTMRLVVHRDLVDEDVHSIVRAVRGVAETLCSSALASYTTTTLAVTSASTSATQTVTSQPANPHPIPTVSEATAKSSASSRDQSPESVISSLASPSPPLPPTTTSLSSSERSNTPSEPEAVKRFEEVRVRGMSVSSEGFCVILQGTSTDRCVRVLVTPEDPMSDGLDHDEVESSEAVTLLQLLQGIDVETHLSKDTLNTMFSSISGNGASEDRQKYALKAVQLSGIGRGKDFSAMLIGSTKKKITASGCASEGAVDGESAVISIGVPVADNGAQVLSPTPQVFDGALENVIAPAPAPVKAATGSAVVGTAASTGSSGSDNDNINRESTGNASATAIATTLLREVPAGSAFFTIALALRHSVPIEVRHDLLLDEKNSFRADEVLTYYPKLLATATRKSETAQSTQQVSLSAGTASAAAVVEPEHADRGISSSGDVIAVPPTCSGEADMSSLDNHHSDKHAQTHYVAPPPAAAVATATDANSDHCDRVSNVKIAERKRRGGKRSAAH